MSGFDDDVRQFLASPKKIVRAWRWRSQRSDFTKAGAGLVLVGDAKPTGWLQLAAHTYREPKKFSFSVIFHRRRVLGLDVEPGSYHFNASTLTSVLATHWQEWPNMEAIEDHRNLIYSQWLDAFLGRAKIERPLRRPMPSFGVQLGLKL